MEGVTYESNMSLLDEVNYNGPSMESETDDVVIVFYDLETGGFDLARHDILQVCMKSAEKI